jgi:uncharacterized protein involved in tellurium resistance
MMSSGLKKKQEFWSVYDYGMGGIWFVIQARDVVDVREKYPFLTIFETRPSFFVRDEEIEIRKPYTQDIDADDIEAVKGLREDYEAGKL